MRATSLALRWNALAALLTIALITLAISSSALLAEERGSNGKTSRRLRALSVCSDAEDLIFTHRLIGYLSELNVSVELEMLFLNRFSRDAPEHLKRLRDAWFLRRFDQVWIFDFDVENSIGSIGNLEVDAIKRSVREGRTIIAGISTYMSSAAGSLSEVLGVEIAGASSESLSEIRFANSSYRYVPASDSYYLRSASGVVAARFEPSGLPAVVVNKYGSGVAVLLNFDPVNQAVRLGNRDAYSLAREIILLSEKHVGERLEPPMLEILVHALADPASPLSVALYALAALIVLELLACLGLLPYRLLLLLMRPLVLLRLFCRSSCREYLEVIEASPGISMREIARRTNRSTREVRRALAVLEIRNLVESHRASSGEAIFKLKSRQESRENLTSPQRSQDS